MVNQCCVVGCGRSSKTYPQLTYYTVPRGLHRRIVWLKAIGRHDLYDKQNVKSTFRVCSRHFDVDDMKKNRILEPNAVPKLHLPNSGCTDKTEQIVQHEDIVCNSCKLRIIGFRYKCVTCLDYDLCPKCETRETHPGHYMLRIPKPLKFKMADDLIKKWRSFFQAEHVNPDCLDSDSSGCSSDDEPIASRLARMEPGVGLAESVKDLIRAEVTRVLAVKPDEKRKRKKEKRKSEDLTVNKALGKTKKAKVDNSDGDASSADSVPVEVAFADVNEYKDVLTDVKTEVLPNEASEEEPIFQQPLLSQRLGDDLSELMMDMTSSTRTYKYN